jgi:hypothetical protein
MKPTIDSETALLLHAPAWASLHNASHIHYLLDTLRRTRVPIRDYPSDPLSQALNAWEWELTRALNMRVLVFETMQPVRRRAVAMADEQGRKTQRDAVWGADTLRGYGPLHTPPEAHIHSVRLAQQNAAHRHDG